VLAGVLTAVTLLGTACQSDGGETDGLAPSGVPAPGVADPAPSSSVVVASTGGAVTVTRPTGAEPSGRDRVQSPLAAMIADVGDAFYDSEAHRAASAQPVALTIADIAVNEAPVEGVGVLPDGRFEVPDARVVGWYRFGPAPRDAGTSVLAAHLNYDGVDGVFRRLADVDIGAEVVVALAEGDVARYRITEIRVIDKNLLPPDEIWNREGPRRLVLITCGGRYDASRRSYDDNVVVFADPV
jgi:LPXTG-site transpeptidase (sortase) family protein